MNAAGEEAIVRVGIAGAGAVGCSVAAELVEAGHKVLLIEIDRHRFDPARVPDAHWFLADACEQASLEECRLELCDVVIAATGDDKVNLAVSLLAKTEFGVPRVIARVNDTDNEWLFTDAWGVDLSVSTPSTMAASVEGAIDVGRLTRLRALGKGDASLLKLTLSIDNSLVGQAAHTLVLPDNTALITVLRGGDVILPRHEDVLAVGDELLFVADRAGEAILANLIAV